MSSFLHMLPSNVGQVNRTSSFSNSGQSEIYVPSLSESAYGLFFLVLSCVSLLETSWVTRANGVRAIVVYLNLARPSTGVVR